MKEGKASRRRLVARGGFEEPAARHVHAPGPRVRCVVTDVDGTLVDASTTVRPADAEAAQRLIASGGAVHLATGRNELAASWIADQLPTTAPAILYNGARLVDLGTGDVWWAAGLAATAHRRLLDLVRNGALGADPVVYSEGRVLTARLSEGVRELARRDRTPIEAVEDLEVLRDRPVTKWLLITHPEGVDRLEERIGAVCSQVRTTRSEPGYVEVLPQGVDKGTALVRLAECCGYELGEIAAVGDRLNDLPMLRRAGLPIAVESAHPEVVHAAVATVADPPHGSLAAVVDLVLSRRPFDSAGTPAAPDKSSPA